ncbi:unnamed protein product [Durusdinium trenchii]|uniref:UBC core domain-containing protein n=1 Tax=Durusdinium trenchii TaxID=1381693 RepID=A0ABP0JUA6_9DINO
MGEVLLRSHLQALRSREIKALQRLQLEDNVIELKLCVEGQAHRLNFLIYEVESYPDSGGIMMGEDGESELVEAINELLGDREHLELNEVLSSAMQVLKVDAPELELQDSDEDLVSDEGTGIMDDSYERCNRPGWKKMKWQEVEDQRLSVREKRRKGEPPELTNEELKAAGEQIFNSKEAFSILSNELYSLQTQMTQGIQADAVDFNVYHWAVRLRGFEGCLAEDLKQLQASQGYDFVELRVFFKEDLHPFYPPSFALIRPRLQGRYDVQAALACHPRLQLKGWSPFQSSRDLLLAVQSFLGRISRVDLHSARNDLEAHPEGAFSPLEQRLAQLQRLRGIKPQQLQVDVPGNAYEDDPWAQSSELAASCFGALGGKRSPAQTGEGEPERAGGWAKGVGYGSDTITGRSSWDPAAMHAAQQAQDLELRQLVAAIGSDLSSEGQGVCELVEKSCLLPFLEGELASSYMDLEERPSFFQEVLKLVEAMCPLLPPQSLEALRSRMTSCKDSAETFLQTLGARAAEWTEDTTLARRVVLVAETLERHCGSHPATSVADGAGQRPDYCKSLKPLQLDAGDIEGDHCFLASVQQEFAGLASMLPLNASSAVLVRSGQQHQQLWRALITGPAETPYSGGCFIFDIYFPWSYPNTPPQVRLLTTGRDTVCFNPNLYSNGKVCLSLLGTWQGETAEQWDSQTSRAVQVLISIQSLILVSQPYFNEPGFEREIGTEPGERRSREYNRSVKENCIRWAMIDVLKNPKKEFTEAIKLHFKLQAEEIEATIQAWIEAEAEAAHRQTLQNLLASLKEELQRL